MSTQLPHVRHGSGSVRPYVYGRLDLREFVRGVFEAEELEYLPDARGGAHVEARIGDSMVVLELGDFLPGAPTTASIYVYVEDVDAAYARALALGALSIGAPEDKPYGERGAGVRDSFGNTWWIATYKG